MDRNRTLVVDPAFVEFDDQDWATAAPSRFEKEDIIGIRYGIKPIKGYMFYIGRTYFVDIKHESGTVLSIRLKTLYRIRQKELETKFGAVLQALFSNYYEDLVRHYLNLFDNQLPFDLLGVGFTPDGLIFKKGDDIIPWDDIGTSDYRSYYALFCKSDPQRYCGFNYLEEWNTQILYVVSRRILQEKNVWMQ